jgi:aspartyl-tRNA synthetase
MQYGNDKPDIRFGMEFGELNAVAQNKEFAVFNTAEVVGIAVPGRKLPEKKPIYESNVQSLWNGLCEMQRRWNYKSSVDKFYDQDDLSAWEDNGAKAGDMIILSGPADKTRTQLSALRS